MQNASSLLTVLTNIYTHSASMLIKAVRHELKPVPNSAALTCFDSGGMFYLFQSHDVFCEVNTLRIQCSNYMSNVQCFVKYNTRREPKLVPPGNIMEHNVAQRHMNSKRTQMNGLLVRMAIEIK